MTNDIYMGLLRHLLTLVGVWVAQKGYASGAMIDTALGSIMSLAGFGASVMEKINRPAVEASSIGAQAPAPSGASGSQGPVSKLTGALVLAIALSVSFVPAALADGLPSRSKVAAPCASFPCHPDAKLYQPAPRDDLVRDAMSGSFYLAGGVAGDLYSDDRSFSAGLVAGYLARTSNFGFGLEADAFRRLENVEPPKYSSLEEIDNWLFTARARGGVFLTNTLFAYGTAGLAWSTGAQGDLVWGGGLELSTDDKTFIRGEVLRFEDGLEPTTARFVVGRKF